jgi:hypothetical protein
MKIMLDEFMIMMDTLSGSLRMSDDASKRFCNYHITDRKKVWKDLHSRMSHIRIEKIRTLDPDVVEEPQEEST